MRRITDEMLEALGDPTPLVHPVISQSQIVSLHGEPESSKSLFGWQIAWGMVEAGESVLVIDYEMGNHARKQRSSEFGYKLNDLHYVDQGPTNLDTPDGSDMLGEYIQEHGITAVVLDAWSGAVEGGENDNDTYRAFGKFTLGAFRAHGISAFIIDHLSWKRGDKKDKSGRGASRKLDEVDIAWHWDPVKAAGDAEHFDLKNMKDRDGQFNGATFNYRKMREPLRFDLIGDPTKGNVSKIIEFIEDHGIDIDQSLDAIGEEIRKWPGREGKGFKRSDLSKARQMVQERRELSGGN